LSYPSIPESLETECFKIPLLNSKYKESIIFKIIIHLRITIFWKVTPFNLVEVYLMYGMNPVALPLGRWEAAISSISQKTVTLDTTIFIIIVL
jgi:hypothetical protein